MEYIKGQTKLKDETNETETISLVPRLSVGGGKREPAYQEPGYKAKRLYVQS